MVVVEEVVVEDGEDEEELRRAEEKEAEEKAKAREYLDFRRKFDQMKADTEGVESKSNELKQQGNNFFKLGLYMQASTMYSEAIELQPESAVLHCNRSMAYLKQDMPLEALEDANRSLEIDGTKDNIKAYWRKSQALLDLERPEDSEEVADIGLALQAGNDHINRVRRKARETIALRKLGQGEWTCKMANGVEKRYTFDKDGSMKIFLFGQHIPATFDLSVEGNPRSMRVAMKADGIMGAGPPPPPVPYIFEFHDDGKELWLCSDPAKLPERFEGPGFDKLRLQPGGSQAQEEESNEPLDVRCARYIKEMSKVMPIIPPQLPEQPSEQEVNKEVLIMERLSQLKRRYGVKVHQRAVELSKNPAEADSEELSKLAAGLQQRFLTRRIFAEADVKPWPPVAPKAEVAPQTAPVAPAPAAPSAASAAPVVPEVQKPAVAAPPPMAAPAAPVAPAAPAKAQGGGCLAGFATMCCGSQQ